MTTPFPHDFSDERYTEALLDLFKAGTGVAPPTLAGRDTETAIFQNRLLISLRKKHAPPADMVLFGPRGNGKTVLLEKLKRQAVEAKIGVLALRPAQLDSPEVLLRTLLQATPTLPDDDTAQSKLLEKLQGALRRSGLALDGLRMGAPGISVALSGVSDDELRVRTQEWLGARCRTQPLLVTVDEAHTLEGGIGRRLLNLSEQLRAAGVPFVLILAGTPQLEAHLGGMSATFWSRSEILPIGRLSAEATEQALTEPLTGYSVSIEPDALAAVVADSQCYPYFIQLWGRALCGALVGQAQGRTVTLDLVEQAAPEIEARRARYYGERYLELEERELLEAAVTVGAAFGGAERVHKAALCAALRAELGLALEAAKVALDEMAALGYLWRTTVANDLFEPGIPSLMTHVQERLEVAMDEEMTAAVRPRP